MVALAKFAAVEEKLGGYRLQQDQDAAHKFHNVLRAAFDGPIAVITYLMLRMHTNLVVMLFQ
jgi:hypothetical protein